MNYEIMGRMKRKYDIRCFKSHGSKGIIERLLKNIKTSPLLNLCQKLCVYLSQERESSTYYIFINCSPISTRVIRFNYSKIFRNLKTRRDSNSLQ